MKKIQILMVVALVMGSIASGFSQLQFSTVKVNGESLTTIPRYSWNIPFNFTIADMTDSDAMIGAVNIKNEGIIYELGEDKYKHRGISIGPEIGFRTVIGKKVLLKASYSFDYFFHYKRKFFREGKRDLKDIQEREWFPNQINNWNHSVKVGIGAAKGFYLYAEYYFRDFLNPDYTEEVDGVTVKPYEGFETQKFNIGFNIDMYSSKKKTKEEVIQEEETRRGAREL